jgi:hypothetical protein
MSVPLSPITITLRGRDRPIRYSILAFEEFERLTGSTLTEALAKPVHAIKLRDIAIALQIGMKYGGGNGSNLSADRILQMIDDDNERHGLQVLKQMFDGLSAAVQRATAQRRDEHGAPLPAETEDEGSPFGSGSGAPPSNSTLTNSSD